MRKKVDSRIRTLIENGVKLRHRSLFIIVGDAGREQVVNLHYMLSKAVVKARPSVLWCYKKELGFTSHRKKRMRQIKKMVQRGLLDPEKDDPFELFISATDINYCYYKETARVLGNTFGMLVLQDFEAVTPNVLARTVETVEGGGPIVLLLKSMNSLKQLYTMSMDAHARFRTESHVDVQPRFNERFILSLASCASCLVLDDELNVLPISTHSRLIKPIAPPADGAMADGPAGPRDSKELRELKDSLRDTQPVGTIVSRVATLDQAKAVLTFVEAASEKSLRTTVALTAGRGRGKSAALGLSLAAAIAYGYANIFVTSPSPENLRTLFEFVLKGFDALEYKEHIDFSVVESTNPELKKTVVRINVFHQHRQTIQYIEPTDAALLSQAELLVIDEAAAIPMPQVRALLGPYLVFLASTVNGYEGTGRALSMKLIQQLRTSKAPSANGGGANGSASDAALTAAVAAAEGGVGVGGSGRTLREVSLEEPIRYARGDPIELWLHEVLCLDATSHTPVVSACPHPSECSLYWVDRDALFSYHSASEAFLQRMVALFVASHYKNTPNDLQLMSDAPAHQLFALLGPVDVNATKLPDVLAVVQICLEGQISKESVNKSMSRGEAPSGDLMPWTLAQQFQETDFAMLSGARVVRVAVHPDMQGMGYGSRAIEQLKHYYSGHMGMGGGVSKKKASSSQKGTSSTSAAGAGEGGEGGVLLTEQLAPRAELPPLLLSLEQRPAEALHWFGSSFGLTQPLFKFWHRLGFLPVYMRQTVNDITGEHTAIVIQTIENAASAEHSTARAGWAMEYATDFRKRLTSLLGMSMRSLPVDLALSLLDPNLGATDSSVIAASTAPSVEEIAYHIGPYDLRRLHSYARNLVDHHLIMDLVPLLASLRFTNKLTTPLSHVQAAILLGMGLQHKTIDAMVDELGLPASQLLALFNKAVRKMVGALRAVEEVKEGASLPSQGQADAAGRAMEAMSTPLAQELDAGAAASLQTLEADQAKKQKAWLAEVEEGGELAKYAIKGSEAEWAEALGSGAPPGHVSLKSEGGGEGSGGGKGSKGSARSESKKGKRREGADGRSTKRRKSS
mmetsp:Transcript_62876/g.124180  ORF Transcript_62876/g.124180 Transcript_62876/m.124180 type:complete len:1081 (-) Transcript_62876:105-3347(-)|eukprot:CAMPEP_0174721980 /NCGR_PEP_ID=MMETSP1094-20130205/37551_1 /TAXON_ID=156173 /ORGANISM="Chrysochromulina brevifilum, Strain UTEX LB 985" /LENGTH=1080 /DNA_ID=CAMNT_0015922761 /DNA_START=110 /DNA_END=3352 /DNA_ORIENTATION=+